MNSEDILRVIWGWASQAIDLRGSLNEVKLFFWRPELPKNEPNLKLFKQWTDTGWLFIPFNWSLCSGRSDWGRCVLLQQVNATVDAEKCLRSVTHSFKGGEKPKETMRLAPSLSRSFTTWLSLWKFTLQSLHLKIRLIFFSPPEECCLFLLESVIQAEAPVHTGCPPDYTFSFFRVCYWIMWPVNNCASLQQRSTGGQTKIKTCGVRRFRVSHFAS